MANKVRVEAKDVSTAIAQGLKELGLRRDQAEVTVLESPKKGFLGFGSKPAVVEIRQKRWTSADLDAQIYMDVPKKKKPSKGVRGGRDGRDNKRSESRDDNKRRGGRKPFARANSGKRREEPREKTPKANEPQLLPCEQIQNAVIPEHLKQPMQEAKQYLEQVLSHMGVKVENLNVWWDEKQQRILLTFDCDHPAIVIGKEGKTLEAIQYLSTLALSRHFDKPISVITDTQNYWRKAEDKINAEIEKGVSMIKSGHGVFRFRPMSAQLRRYIHRALEGSDIVSTSSEGEGKWRKVTLRPKAKAVCDDTNDETFTACECEDAAKAAAVCEAAAALNETEKVLEHVKEIAEQAQQVAASMEEHEKIAEQVNVIVEEHVENKDAALPEAAPVSEPAQEQPELAKEALSQTVPDDAAGATCYVGNARNCGEGEIQVGCACVPEFESPKQAEENNVPQAEEAKPEVKPEAQSAVLEKTAQDDAEGGTCSAEIARNCQEGETQSGCACGPLFETPAEADKTENK